MANTKHKIHAAKSDFYARWARLILRYRFAVLVVLTCSTLGLAYYAATHLRVDNSVESFAPPNSIEIKALKDYRATFGRADPFLILIEGAVFDLDFLKRLDALHGELRALKVDVRPPTSAPKIEEAPPTENTEFGFEDDGDDGWGEEDGGGIFSRVTSLINVRQTRAVGDGIQVDKLMTPLPTEEQIADKKKMILADSFLVGQVVDEAGRFALVTAYPINMYDGDLEKVTTEVLKIVESYSRDGFRIYVTGPPAIASLINQMVISDLTRLGGYSLILVVLVLAALFRHWIGILGPVLVILVSVFWTLGAMALFDLPVTILSGILPAFLFCVGVCDSIHMLSIYRSLRVEGVENKQAIIDAVAITGPPVFFTSLTTICGLFSLNFASVTVIAEMGIAGGVGVAFAWFFSLTLLPIILTFNEASVLGAREESKGLTIRFLEWAVGYRDTQPRRRDVRVLILTAVVALLCTWGVSQIRVYHDDLEILPDGSMVKVAVRVLDENVGGAALAELVLTPQQGSLKDIEVLRGLSKVIDDVLAYRDPVTNEPVVTHALSLVDVFKETRRAFNGGGQDEYRLPTSQNEVNDYAFVFENQSPGELGKLTTVDWSKTHVSMRVKWREATDYGPLLRYIETSLTTHLGDKAKWVGTGPVYVVNRLVKVMLMDLAVSFGTAFAFVTCFMLVMLGNVRMGLIAILPNLFPIMLVLGMMGLLGLPLDLNSLLIASIALGIAVDDTVHFLHHFKTAYRDSDDCQSALESASYHAGQAMITTSIVLVAGFSVLCLATNAAVFRFGFLTALTVLAALLTDLIALPSILRVIYKKRA
ncbi:MAG: MMPL family transporter [Myxococcota bacterium]|nr:MMPL family transporter [Myxococcota bacterium]